MPVSDTSGASGGKSGARAFARLDIERARREQAASEAVTLQKIGDFLEIDFRRLFVWLRAGFVAALLLAVIGAGAGAAFGLLSKPRYTVSTDILVDPSNLQVVANDIHTAPGQVDAQILAATSKMRVLTSGNVLARVVDELDLTHDPEFYDPTGGSSLSGLFGGGSAAATKTDPKVVALANLQKRVNTNMDEKSYVATLQVSAQTGDKAVKISDAMVKAFQAELAQADADSASRAASQLDAQLSAQKQAVETAEQKVEAYRRAHNLLAVAPDGQLASTQTLTQLNSQVVDAQSKVIAAKATYDAAVAAGRNATTADPVVLATLTALRDKEASLRQEYNADAMIYGPRHPTLVQLGAQLAAVDKQLDAAVARVVASAKSSVGEANAALTALTSKRDTLTGGVFTDNEAQVTLRELQRDADSKTAIYEAFLSRARQVTGQEQIDSTNVRVISTAVPPTARAWPPSTVVLMVLGAVLGFGLGMVLAVSRGIMRDVRQPARPRVARAA